MTNERYPKIGHRPPPHTRHDMTETLPSQIPPEDDEISLIDLAIVLGEEKKVLFGIPILATLIAVIYTLTLTPIYTAKTVIAQVQHKTILESRTLQDALIKQFNLEKIWAINSPAETRKKLAGITRIITDKNSGTLAIEIDDPSPNLAAQIANGYAQALQQQLEKMDVAQIRSRREFYAELIRRVQSNPEKEAVNVSILVRARLTDIFRQRENEYAALRQSGAYTDPILVRRIHELESLNTQLITLEQLISPKEYSNITERNSIIDQQKIVLDVLNQQHEQAKMDEAREPSFVQIIDIAILPEKKSGPKRTQTVMLAGIAGLLMGVLAAFARHAWRKNTGMGRMAELKRAWSIARS